MIYRLRNNSMEIWFLAICWTSDVLHAHARTLRESGCFNQRSYNQTGCSIKVSMFTYSMFKLELRGHKKDRHTLESFWWNVVQLVNSSWLFGLLMVTPRHYKYVILWRAVVDGKPTHEVEDSERQNNARILVKLLPQQQPPQSLRWRVTLHSHFESLAPSDGLREFIWGAIHLLMRLLAEYRNYQHQCFRIPVCIGPK